MKDNTVSIRVYEEDRDWLMANRGAGNIAKKVHELIIQQYNKK